MAFAAEKSESVQQRLGMTSPPSFFRDRDSLLLCWHKVLKQRGVVAHPPRLQAWLADASLAPSESYPSAWAGEMRHCWAQKRKTEVAGGGPRPTSLSIQTEHCSSSGKRQCLGAGGCGVFPEEDLSLPLPLPAVLPSQRHYSSKGRAQDSLSRPGCSVLYSYFLPPQHLIHPWNKKVSCLQHSLAGAQCAVWQLIKTRKTFLLESPLRRG